MKTWQNIDVTKALVTKCFRSLSYDEQNLIKLPKRLLKAKQL